MVCSLGAGDGVAFGPLFALYSLSVAFYMPTAPSRNSVAYAVLEGAGGDTVKDFPPIRVRGTVEFHLLDVLVCATPRASRPACSSCAVPRGAGESYSAPMPSRCPGAR